MSYDCAQLSQPDESGVQTCVVWVESSPIFPDLTVQQTGQIASSTAIFLCVCAIYRHLRSTTK